eukprot:CAMPEP_0177600416 /NCGR_PEP_ID=MMETSP0419_2-20121207/13612_1 /TAXON_ID=582737 /ORGANISM="Tetraselmis sp., Strain GSL018" /LENGTH=386 /DNA_ID=CAMNT_0019093409 /DNA_START=145 /DNA_END=1305 /DNA_ORIENTATION=+
MHNCIALKVMQQRGWQEVEEEYEWDIFWSDVHTIGASSDFSHSKLQEYQKLNHFPRHVELTRKDLMVKNLKRAARALEKEGRGSEMAFFPLTYILPSDYGPFREEFNRSGGIWIMKPCGRAQGKGIFMVDKIAQVEKWKQENSSREQQETYVISRYLQNPLLVGGKKFDLRIYALVLSYMPLRVYLYRGGFCRFTAARYNMNRDDMKNLYVHLTNVAIQKKGENYDRGSGMKWPIRSLKLYLISKFGVAAANRCFELVQLVVLRSLLAVQPVVTQDKHCFELYGYDVLIDSDLKPWLIEVNASPSLSGDTPADKKMKFSMIDDALELVDVEQRLANALPQSYGGFDLIYNQEACKVHPSMPTLLGCEIPVAKDATKFPEGWIESMT